MALGECNWGYSIAPDYSIKILPPQRTAEQLKGLFWNKSKFFFRGCDRLLFASGQWWCECAVFFDFVPRLSTVSSVIPPPPPPPEWSRRLGVGVTTLNGAWDKEVLNHAMSTAANVHENRTPDTVVRLISTTVCTVIKLCCVRPGLARLGSSGE